MTEPGAQVEDVAGEFPRVYRPSRFRRLLGIVVFVLLASPVPLCLSYFAKDQAERDFGTAAMLACMCPAMLVVGLYILWWVLRIRVTLWHDRIESREMTSSRTLMRSEIFGRRVWRAPDTPPQTVLIPRDNVPKEFVINRLCKYDAVFQMWLESIPDLDAEEAYGLAVRDRRH